MDCLRLTPVILLSIRCSSVRLCFSRLTRRSWLFFTVHEEHLGAVALTGFGWPLTFLRDPPLFFVYFQQ